jgi:hypothetical protein
VSLGKFFAKPTTQLDPFLVCQSEEIVAEEPMPSDPQDVRKVAVALALGGIASAAIIQSYHDENKRSRARRMTSKGSNGSVTGVGSC